MRLRSKAKKLEDNNKCHLKPAKTVAFFEISMNRWLAWVFSPTRMTHTHTQIEKCKQFLRLLEDSAIVFAAAISHGSGAKKEWGVRYMPSTL